MILLRSMASLELTVYTRQTFSLGQSSWFCFPSAGITGVLYHVWLNGIFKKKKISTVFRHTILDLPLVVVYFLNLSCYLVPFPFASQTSQEEIKAAGLEVHVCNPSLWSFQMEYQELRLQWDIGSSLSTAWASGDPTQETEPTKQ